MDIQPKDEGSDEGSPDQSDAQGSLTRPIVLVGLMGAGKTSVGRRLATLMKVEFIDSDERIVEAAGMSIPDIFDSYGEPAFRDVERRVIANLLDGEPAVIAFGGGAFVDDQTRDLTLSKARSIWLRADVATLVQRTSRKKGTRPLLETGDPEQILRDLHEKRGPVYAKADIVVDTGQQPAQSLAEELLNKLEERGWLA